MMGSRSDVDGLAPLGPTVSVWAHPDDETYLAGGVYAALRDQGVRVVCATATRGEAGAVSFRYRDGRQDNGVPIDEAVARVAEAVAARVQV